jgi:hypothetical protein
MYKTFILMLFILGIILVTASISKSIGEKSKEKIIYRYLPRTLAEEQEEPAMVSEIFATMFTQPSTWIGGMNDLDTRKTEAINQYFVSQI